jgi:hypothetical protein
MTSIGSSKGTLQIVSKNQVILADTLTAGQVECVRKANGWWLITHRRYSNLYYIISLSGSGVDSIKTQQIGISSVPGGDAGGQAVFSPNGMRYARFTPADQLFLFDFDPVSGYLNNFHQIHVSDSGIIGGLAFSPSSQYLYVSSQFDLFQIDTWAEDMQESVVHIAHYDGYLSPFPTTFRLMQLGPDCRIYMIPPNGADVMHVIHEPDLQGAYCNFEQHGIQLPVYNSITLPNFPNYRLGIGPPCDPTITGMVEALPKPEPVRIGPNPATDYLNVWTDIGEARLLFFDLQGQLVFSHDIDGKGLHTVELDLPSGMYVYSIVTGTGIRYTGKLVIRLE